MSRRSFTPQEAFEASLGYFNGDTLAAKSWVSKYALKNSDGEVFERTPDDMHERLADELHRIERKYPNPVSYDEIYEALRDFKYLIPAGSPMTGIGNDLQVSSISNCFVAGNESDSYGGIMRTDEQLVQLMKRRGGVGTDLSHIRPETAPVNNAALTSSGVVSFMDRFSNSTREVAQSGRRGALMLSISITHPDSEKFIDAKLEDGKVTGANISVKITDKFMECVKENKDFIHVFPVNYKLTAEQEDVVRKSKIGEIISFGEGVFAKRNNAKKLWDKIIYNAWKSAEPGVLFWDTIIRESLSDCYSDLGFKTTSTNPCQPSWATVLTPDGIKEFKDVNVGDKIWSSEGWTTIVNKESSGIKPVYEYRTHLGAFIGTEKHRIVSNGEKVEARYAKNIDSLVGSISQDINTADLIAVSKEKAYEFQIILSSIGIKSVILDTDDNKYILRTIDNQSKEGIDKFNEIYKTEFISTEEVFNITVDNSTHTYWTGGLNVSNCGEIPIPPLDSCRLLAINLYSYVKNPFTKEAEFDMILFKKHVKLAQRMMDNIVDLELEKISKIIEKIKNDPEPMSIKRNELELWEGVYDMGKRGRRTGLGVTAEGDMLAALNIRYGVEDATRFSENIHKTLAIEAYKASAIMAKERGSFEIYNLESEKHNPFLNRLVDESKELAKLIEMYGRRNIACLTIAPTGTTSLMTQTTSGIEPVFLPVYTRRKKVNPNDADARVDFVDETGDAFEEYSVFHHKFLVWMEANGYDISKKYSQAEIDELVCKSPYYKATSNDIDWVEKVRMQGAVQKWVDHSISVTVNLPNDVTPELVSDVYMTAWEVGCKGMTVYRDGSRNGVLIKNEDKKPDTKTETGEVFSYKRPKSLHADILRFNNNKEKWVAFVGIRDGKPYEIFTGRIDSDDLSIPAKVMSGKITKRKVNGVGVYDFEYIHNDKTCIVHELSKQFNKEYWNYAKLISGNLRHHMPVEQVVKLVQSLYFDNDSINSWKVGVVRALKKYIKDGVEASGVVCEECGSASVVYQEGCLICKNCGSSKCG